MKKLPLSIFFFIFLGCYILFLLGYFFGPSQILFMDDQAFSQALSERILNGELLLVGLPSHLGGRHLGPFYLWFVSFFSSLSSGDYPLFVKLITVFKLISLSLIFIIGHKLIRSPAVFWLSSIITMAIILRGHSFFILTIDWANNLLIATSSLLLLVFYCALRFGWPLFLPFVLSVSLSLQTHLSSIPMVAAFALFLGIRLLKTPSAKWSRNFIGLNIFTVLALLALWVPVLYYEITYSQNFTTVLFDRGITPESSIGILESALVYFSLVNSLIADSQYFTRISLFLGVVCALFSLIFLVVLYRKDKYFLLANFVASGLAVLVVAQLSGAVHEYYFYSLTPSVLLVVLLLAASLLKAVFLLYERRLYFAISSICVFAITSYLVIGAFSTIVKCETPVRASLLHAREVSSIIRKQIQPDTLPAVYVHDSELSMRADAIHFFLGSNSLDRMRYRKVLSEIPRHLPRPEQRFLLQCGEGVGKKVGRRFKGWNRTGQVDLKSCTTCKGCVLYQYSNSTLAELG